MIIDTLTVRALIERNLNDIRRSVNNDLHPEDARDFMNEMEELQNAVTLIERFAKSGFSVREVA